METVIYNQEGKKEGAISLPESVFGLPWNADLVHQVVVSMQANARHTIAHTKNRGEVRGGGKKPWQQKGTGRARHGSTRSPIWVGGGIAHGPRKEKDYSKKINKKMKAKALFTILSQKLRDGEVLFVGSLTLPAIKTAAAKGILRNLSGVSGFETLATKRKNAAYISLLGMSSEVKKSFRNMGNVSVDDVAHMNPADVLRMKYLIIGNPEESVKFLAGKMK